MPTLVAPRPLVFALLAVAAVSLTGCAPLVEQLRNESGKTFASVEDLNGNWGKEAPWLPADASEILTHESTVSDTAIIGVTSKEPLDDGDCVETPRESGPAFASDWSPESITAERVFVCGNWAVVPTNSGYFAWTPIDPDEVAAANGK